jgi:hypothetical protein
MQANISMIDSRGCQKEWMIQFELSLFELSLFDTGS